MLRKDWNTEVPIFVSANCPDHPDVRSECPRTMITKQAHVYVYAKNSSTCNGAVKASRTDATAIIRATAARRFTQRQHPAEGPCADHIKSLATSAHQSYWTFPLAPCCDVHAYWEDGPPPLDTTALGEENSSMRCAPDGSRPMHPKKAVGECGKLLPSPK